MTVTELIEGLKKMSPTARVAIGFSLDGSLIREAELLDNRIDYDVVVIR